MLLPIPAALSGSVDRGAVRANMNEIDALRRHHQRLQYRDAGIDCPLWTQIMREWNEYAAKRQFISVSIRKTASGAWHKKRRRVQMTDNALSD